MNLHLPMYVSLHPGNSEACLSACSEDEPAESIPLPTRLFAASSSLFSETAPARVHPSFLLPDAFGSSSGSRNAAGDVIDQPHGGKRTPLSSKAADFIPAFASAKSNIFGWTTEERVIEDTTVIMYNLPWFYTRDKLMDLMDCRGFSGQYDFVYLPVDSELQGHLGYALVNLTTEAQMQRFFQVFHHFKDWSPESSEVCDVCSAAVQGLRANIKRYRNHWVMGPQVPDAFKPALLSRGTRVPFPAPSKRLSVRYPSWRMLGAQREAALL